MLKWLLLPIRIYLMLALGALLMIPVGYALMPVFHILDQTPQEIISMIAQVVWWSMVAVFTIIVIAEHLPAPVAPASSPAPSEDAEPADRTPALPSGPRPEYVRGRFQIYRGRLTTLPPE